MQVGFRKGLCATKKERGWTQEILAPYSLKIRFVSARFFCNPEA
jgi:hypothetical protein